MRLPSRSWACGSGARVDENVAVTKHPRGKHRQRHERTITVARQADEFGGRQFRDVEFLPAHHAIEDVAAGFERNAGEIDALDRTLPSRIASSRS